MSDRKKFFTNIVWLLSEHGIRLISALIMSFVLARQLGVEGYGIFQYTMSLVVVFSSLSFICGGEVVVPKLTNANEFEQKEIMGNAFLIRLFFSIIAYFTLLIFVYATEESFNFYLVAIIGIIILLNESFGIVTAYLQSQTIIKHRSRLLMVGFIIKMVILLILYKFSVENIFIYGSIVAFEGIFVATGLCFIYKYINKNMFFNFSKSKIFELFKQGLPFFIALMMYYLFSRLDIIFLRWFSDFTTVGLYSSAHQLLSSTVALSPILAMSFAPLFVYKFSEIGIIKRNVIIISTIMFFVALFLAVLLSYLAPLIIHFIFSTKFDSAITIFRYMIWTIPLYFLDNGLYIYIIKMQFGKILIYKYASVLFVSIVAYLYFIPKYQAMGVVYGYGISYFASCLFGMYILLKGK